MSNEDRLRHYGKFQNEEIVVVGYKKSLNQVLICRVNALPADEQMELRRIASSEAAQREDYLVQTLQGQHHRSGVDWFTHMANLLRRNTGAVLSVPIKDITDMNADQAAFFKGYGRSISEQANEEAAAPEAFAPEAPAPIAGQTPPAADPTLVALLGKIVEGQERMAETQERVAEGLEKLEKKVKPARKATTRKTSTTRRKPATSAGKASAKTEKSVVESEAPASPVNVAEGLPDTTRTFPSS